MKLGSDLSLEIAGVAEQVCSAISIFSIFSN